jgi:hypothetical protein
MKRKPPRIVGVAIIHDCQAYSLPAPNRHHDVIAKIVAHTGAKCVDGEQGFIDEIGTFLRRKPAMSRAIETGQLMRATGPSDLLFSEDIW